MQTRSKLTTTSIIVYNMSNYFSKIEKFVSTIRRTLLHLTSYSFKEAFCTKHEYLCSEALLQWDKFTTVTSGFSPPGQ